MIQLILHTDLSKHFDHIGKLKTLAASKGHKKLHEDHLAAKGAAAAKAESAPPPPQVAGTRLLPPPRARRLPPPRACA